MTRGRRRWLAACSGSPEKNRYEDDRGQDHQRRRKLRLAKSGKHVRVGAQEAEEETSSVIQPEVEEAQHAVRQASLEPLVKWKKQAEDHYAQHHLVRDLRMDNLAWLAQRVRVDVLDAPGEGGRRAVMLSVDDVADAADGQSEHGRWSTGVQDLPEGVLRPARPDDDSHHGAEQAAPLADAAFGQGEYPQELSVGEEPEVLPHIEKTGADKAQGHHPGEAVAGAGEIGDVLLEQPEADARGGDDAQHCEHSVPGDQDRPDAQDVRVEVDDDRQWHQSGMLAARCSRSNATSFGSR